MEYIQCSHCNKKYSLNDKVRAAAGRTIPCKGCGESFEIVLFETPTASAPEVSQPAVEKEPVKAGVDETNDHKPQHKQKRRAQQKAELEPTKKKKTSPSMLLGIAIVILSAYLFYQDRSIDIGAPFVATEPAEPSDYPSTPTGLVYKEEAPKSEPKIPAHKEFSEACKNIAAQQWVMDYTMMHGMPEKGEYTHMLDESMQNTAEIRKKCDGSNTVQEVLATATKGLPPKWLEKHVSALITLGKKTPRF